MMEPLFCYRIKPEAKLAFDVKGIDTAVYTQLEIEGGKSVDKATYDEAHLDLKTGLAQSLGIDESLIECISLEEYKENMEDYENE